MSAKLSCPKTLKPVECRVLLGSIMIGRCAQSELGWCEHLENHKKDRELEGACATWSL